MTVEELGKLLMRRANGVPEEMPDDFDDLLEQVAKLTHRSLLKGDAT